jgi:hypothetical protein
MTNRARYSPSNRKISPVAEAVRIFFAAAAGVIGLWPFLHNGIMGGSDGKWYTAIVADNVEQWRMGLWPVFVGQTRFAAIGTLLPIRVAPYLQHLTVAIDLATLHTLTPYLLLNLAIVFSGAAGGLSAYLCLRSIIPSRREEALFLSILYIWSPGVIGLPYTGQLFMSEMTLPFLPMVFTGAYRIFKVDNFSGWALMAAGSAGCWLAHSPIGLWALISASIMVALRWASGKGWNGREATRAIGAVLLFAALCGYVFVSLSEMTPPDAGHIPRSLLIQNVSNTFPAVTMPLTRYASEVTDLQLGWSLFALLAAGIVIAFVSRRPALVSLGAVALLFSCLVFPIPGVNRWLWGAVPQGFIDITNAAPTQRLYAILAACTVTLAAACLAAYPQKHRRYVAVLGMGLLWSGLELKPFFLRGSVISNKRAVSEEALRPENLLLTRFSLGMLTYDNRFFSNGVVDFGMEQRVLAPDLRTYIVTNVGAVAPGSDFGRKGVRRRLTNELVGSSPPGEKVWVNFDKSLTLLPGTDYLLALDFSLPDWPGVLELKGDGFQRDYDLPSSGMPFAFGSGKFNSRVIPLSSSSSKPLNVSIAFINQIPDADLKLLHDFGSFELIRYDPNKLPIRLKSMAPYVAEVSSPSPGWLETFRCFTPGWSATVNGNAVPVRRSWNGLVAIPIGKGESEVRLSYRPPFALLASYWGTWAAWLALGAVTLRHKATR